MKSSTLFEIRVIGNIEIKTVMIKDCVISGE